MENHENWLSEYAADGHLNPMTPGRGRLAVFPRCSLGPYGSRYGRFARALKNSQLTCGDVTIICETVHLGFGHRTQV